MKAHVVSCAKCGADLPAEFGTVRCTYCGKETLLRPTQPQAVASPVLRAASPDPRRGSRSAGCFVAMGLLMVASASAVYFVAAPSSPTAPGGEALRAMESVQEALDEAAQLVPPAGQGGELRSRLCLLGDLNADGVGEVGGLFGESRGDRELMILDGATGAEHWRGESVGQGELHFLCLDSAWLGVVNNDTFSLTLVDGRDPTRQVHRSLSDELDRFGVDDTCFAFRTTDRETVGFSRSDGSETECRTTTRRRPHIDPTTTCGIISTHRNGARFERDDMGYHLRPRRPGTAFLEVAAKRGRTELWEQTLRLVPVGGDAIGCFVGAATPGAFVVAGSPRGDDHGMTLIGLNAESGTERWATDLAATYGHIKSIHYNERYVLLGLLNRVVAVDPLTGELAW